MIIFQNSIMRITLLITLVFLISINHVCAQQDSTITEKDVLLAAQVEQKPSFPGGDTEMYKFVYTEVRYPADAKRFGISGNVAVQFTVNAEGKMEDLKVARGLGYGCDEEALRVMTVMQEKYTWNPGIHKGIARPVIFTLPIKFGSR